MIVRDFLICLLQMYLLEDLEKNMLPYRRENFWGKFLIYFVVALIMLGINHLESSVFNMVMIPVTYMIVSMVVFRGNIWKKLVIVCCYYVLAIIPEFLFATLTNAYGVTGASEGFGTEIEKTLALLLMSTMTFLFIKCINQVTRKRNYLTIENKTFTVLLMLPTATIIILGCVFYSNISFEGMNRVMVPVGASLLLLTNIFIFSVFDRFVEKSEEVKKMDRLYQKSRAEIANLQYMNICSNTMHKCLPAIKKKVNLPIVHIVDATVEEMKREGMSEGLLLGTRFTMEESFNKERFYKNGVNIIIPSLEERQLVHDIIFAELCRGIITNNSKEQYKKIIYKYCKGKETGVILGCTEIGLLIQQNFMDVPIFDTTQIHAKKIAMYMIE